MSLINVNYPVITDLEFLLDDYTLDEIQKMIQAHAFDLSTMARLRPYLKVRVIQHNKQTAEI